jgi:hypothetical protein
MPRLLITQLSGCREEENLRLCGLGIAASRQWCVGIGLLGFRRGCVQEYGGKSPQLAIDGSGRNLAMSLRGIFDILPDVVPANSDPRPTGSSGHKVFCLCPHSLQAYSTRPWSTSALTRLDAPHLPHFTSSRVLPCVMVTFRAIASLTKRSDSWRIASFDIAGARGFRSINSPSPKKSVSSLLNRFLSPRLGRGPARYLSG